MHSAKDVITAVTGSEGYFCGVYIHPTTKAVTQRFYNDVDSLLEAANNKSENKLNAYFALARFTTSDSRLASNANNLNSFFIDLDCREGKEYLTVSAGLKALKQFCKDVDFPTPLIIHSGRGIHAYWPFTESVSAEQWNPAAQRFKKLCQQQEFKMDYAVPADTARVLRIPGTQNYNSETPTAVKPVPVPYESHSFEDLCAAIDKHLVAQPEAVTVPSIGHLSTLDQSTLDKLAGNKQASFKKILRRTLKGTGCEQLKLIATDQANTSEPLWRAGLSIAKYCEDSDKAAYIISSDHPEYTEELTEKKLTGIAGPYHCETFHGERSDICNNCKHWGKIKSPIVLGMELKEGDGLPQEPNQMSAFSLESDDEREELPTRDSKPPKPPKGYKYGQNGGVYVVVKGTDGEWDEVLLYSHTIYLVTEIKDDESYGGLVRWHPPLRTEPEEFYLPMKALASLTDFRSIMSDRGVLCKDYNRLQSYFIAWVDKLKNEHKPQEARRQFGWTKNNQSFVIGPRELLKTKAVENFPSQATEQYFDTFSAHGTLEGWKQAMEFYNQPGAELHQYVTMMGLGSVLMQFIPNVNAAALHIYSKQSGYGKTAALYAAASSWGQPSGIVLEEDDTRNMMMNRAEVMKNIPLLVDEITNSDGENMSKFAYAITKGVQRGRMSGSSNVERKRGKPWNMLVATTANVSLLETVNTFKSMPVAEAQRIMEMKVDKLEGIKKVETDTLNRRLAENYGHAGMQFVIFLMNNLDDILNRLRNMQHVIDSTYNLGPENRFWSAKITCSYMALLISRKIGLVRFPLEPFQEFVRAMVRENRINVMGMTSSIDDVISDYVNDHFGSILVINSNEDRTQEDEKLERDDIVGKLLNKKYDASVVAQQQPRIRLMGRFEPDIGLLSLRIDPFKKWCAKRQINYNSLLEDLRQKHNAKIATRRLGRGTNMDVDSSKVLEMHYGVEET